MDYSGNSFADQLAFLELPCTILLLLLHFVEDSYHLSDCLYRIHNIEVDYGMSLVVQLEQPATVVAIWPFAVSRLPSTVLKFYYVPKLH